MDIRHDESVQIRNETPRGPWPEDLLARVPYWVYQDEANYKREMQRIFEGATWNFVCLEADIPNKGDYRTNQSSARCRSSWCATPTARSTASRTAAPIAAR